MKSVDHTTLGASGTVSSSGLSRLMRRRGLIRKFNSRNRSGAPVYRLIGQGRFQVFFVAVHPLRCRLRGQVFRTASQWRHA